MQIISKLKLEHFPFDNLAVVPAGGSYEHLRVESAGLDWNSPVRKIAFIAIH